MVHTEQTSSPSKVAVLGLGAMGSRMAEKLLDAGKQVTVYNRSLDSTKPLAAKGAAVAKTPAEAVQGCHLAISMVRDDEASQAVWLGESGALPAMPIEAVGVESSTLTLGWTRELAQAAAASEVSFLDAPVSGSRPQAEAGQLVYLVGGDAEVLGCVREALLCMGSAVHHVGPASAGMAMKLAVNAIFGVQVAALAEALGVLRKAGIEDAAAQEILRTLPITSPALQGIGKLIAAGNFAPMFPVDLVEKDFACILQAASTLQTEVPLAKAAQGVYKKAQHQGSGADNIAAVAKLY